MRIARKSRKLYFTPHDRHTPNPSPGNRLPRSQRPVSGGGTLSFRFLRTVRRLSAAAAEDVRRQSGEGDAADRPRRYQRHDCRATGRHKGRSRLSSQPAGIQRSRAQGKLGVLHALPAHEGAAEEGDRHHGRREYRPQQGGRHLCRAEGLECADFRSGYPGDRHPQRLRNGDRHLPRRASTRRPRVFAIFPNG